MNKGSCYGDANSNAMNSTSEKRLNEGDVNRRAMCEISLLDYVRRETNIKPIPKERSGLCYQHLVCYQENLSTNDIKKPRQRIKKAGRQSKIWLSHVKEKHKTSQGMKYAPLSPIDDLNMNSFTRVRRHNQLKPLDRTKMGYRSLPQSREFPHHHKGSRLVNVRRMTYTNIYDDESLRDAEAFLQKRRSRRANKLLDRSCRKPKPPVAPIRSNCMNAIEETNSFYNKVARELSRHKKFTS